MSSVSIVIDAGGVPSPARPAPVSRPENEHEVVALDADGQKPRPVGCRVLDPLLQAKDVRVEVERLVLVADEHARVEDLLQHAVPPVVVVTTPMTRGEQQT